MYILKKINQKSIVAKVILREYIQTSKQASSRKSEFARTASSGWLKGRTTSCSGAALRLSGRVDCRPAHCRTSLQPFTRSMRGVVQYLQPLFIVGMKAQGTCKNETELLQKVLHSWTAHGAKLNFLGQHETCIFPFVIVFWGSTWRDVSVQWVA
jgi:hypothetical protein